ncbi:spore germination protein [Paenibacillus gyeongsangnamensis]
MPSIVGHVKINCVSTGATVNIGDAASSRFRSSDGSPDI